MQCCFSFSLKNQPSIDICIFGSLSKPLPILRRSHIQPSVDGCIFGQLGEPQKSSEMMTFFMLKPYDY
jgi:hypothetical protein